MRPFAKDSQPVVIKGRRKSKLAAKSKSTAALLVKRKKTNNARRKQNDGADDLAKESCQFVPVRRKPLGEYMKLEVSTSKNNSSSPSPSLQGMRMSYAAAIATYPTAGAAGVKVMISPRLKRANKAPTIKVDGSGSGSGSATSKTGSKITADRKFRIFDETPKPHIVRVDAKAERTERAEAAANRTGRVKSSKATVDAEANALGVKFKRLAYNSAARNLNSSQLQPGKNRLHLHW
ncbi:uncharacterized protein LOC108595122 [Drosophila busckii]|uniref:uncharacterized protein LOC108595122 n=1 Tax=Drosophila busckii TaxID=30019 RepID=UPI00083EFFB3|nr:uncharacterized protein LOC108595122 [Drosophila busckii]